MALPATVRGTQLYIKVGDGASPEIFTHPCTINAERGIVFRSTTNDIVVPDCTNPEDPAWRELVKDALSVGITGQGVLDATFALISSWDEWWRSDEGRNIQVWIGTIGYWEGSFKLTEWNPTGDRGGKITTPITLESDGMVSEFTAGP